ncbi:MAG: hypothetical protein KJ749_06660, partial [Planctomycetes bacterium]|nr:hypothetical protein [Planctomycetota bacterium]
VYKNFGNAVREALGRDVTLVETDHFLIWTDWHPRNRPRLAQWGEAMYTALSRQFELDPSEQVFLAKCPIFCFRNKARFLKFARKFDGQDVKSSIGYTRSIERNGHVHVALYRRGSTEADFDRFAGTLVHEGTHAFVHRLYSTRLIPNWINEGLADAVAEQVLGDSCPNAENAALLARQYVRYDWPIEGLLHSVGPIEIHQYALAHSVVAYLQSQGAKQFAEFIRSLKEGNSVSFALAAVYDGMTLAHLEARWRASVRAAQQQGTQGGLPWKS